MSKRVYEIAREQSLESKEVIQRLKEAGVEVKSHSSSVEDDVYERVFGPGVETPNGRTVAQEARAEAERSGHGPCRGAGRRDHLWASAGPSPEETPQGRYRREREKPWGAAGRSCGPSTQ